ncbi:hypothetical protein D1007_44282 [Hordeum vulgare]|nr:hypothetical protein D1007_44282 [Hordeum vulgare]
MADALRVRAERRAAQGVVTAPIGPRTRGHSAGAESAATNLVARKQQASSMHPSVHREGDTTTASSSHARLERVNEQATRLMARELMLYLLADVGYDVWLSRITELVAAPRKSQPHSRSLHPLHPAMKRRHRGHRCLLPHVANSTSPGATCAWGTHLANHHRAPKKMETTARSSSTRQR